MCVTDISSFLFQTGSATDATASVRTVSVSPGLDALGYVRATANSAGVHSSPRSRRAQCTQIRNFRVGARPSIVQLQRKTTKEKRKGKRRKLWKDADAHTQEEGHHFKTRLYIADWTQGGGESERTRQQKWMADERTRE